MSYNIDYSEFSRGRFYASQWQPVRDRLDKLKAYAAKHPNSYGASGWRGAFKSGYVLGVSNEPAQNPSGGDSSVSERWKWYGSLGHVERLFRNVQAAHDVDGAGINHTGWFTDESEDSSMTMYGIVAQLPGKDRAERWVAGVDHNDYDACRLFLGTVYESAEDAARAADDTARLLAESERDYQAVEGARMRIEDLRDDAAKIADDVRKLAVQVSEVSRCGHESAADTLRGLVADHLREARKLLRKASELQDEWGWRFEDAA